jgi:2-isopropylmalate synthase
MVLYSVNAISGSTESQGEVTVRLQNSGRVVNGIGCGPGYCGGLGQSLPERTE